jgi:hypothetical protein
MGAAAANKPLSFVPCFPCTPFAWLGSGLKHSAFTGDHVTKLPKGRVALVMHSARFVYSTQGALLVY